METNPISFSQIFNFTDATGVVGPAIEAMDKLTISSKQFFDIVTNGNLDKLTAEITAIKEALTSYLPVAEQANMQEKAGQQTILQGVGVVQNYAEKLSQLKEQQVGVGKVSKDTQQAIEMVSAAISSQLKRLQEMEAAGKTTGDSYNRLTADIKANTASLESLTKNIKGATDATALESAEMKQLQKILEQIITTQAKLNLAYTEENKTLVDKTVNLQSVNKELKLNAIIQSENTGEYAKALAQRELLIIQYKNEISVSSEAALAKKQEINTIDAWIKANSFQSAAQRLTIGDYKNAREELTLTIERMRELIILQEQEGVEYQKLNARAVQLTLANKQVTQSIKEQTVAAEGSGVAHEKAAAKSIWSWETFTNVFERMGLRMIASLIWWTAIIGAVTMLWEWWTKVDDVTEAATSRLKDYTDGFKELLKSVANSPTEIKSNIEFDTSKMKSQVSIMRDMNMTLDQRFLAYKKIMAIAPNIMDDMDKEGFKTAETTDRMKSQIATMEKYIQLQDKLNVNREKQKEILVSRNKNEAELTELIDKRDKLLGYHPTAEQESLISTRLDHSFGENDLSKTQIDINKLRQQQDLLNYGVTKYDTENANLEKQKAALEGNTKNKKGPKDHTLENTLQDEKDYHTNINLQQKTSFDASDRSFNDKMDLYEGEEDETKRHYKAMLDIIDKYGKASGESELKLHDRREQAKNDLIKQQNQIIQERQKDIADLKKYHDEQIKFTADINDRLEKEVERQQRAYEDLAAAKKKGDIQDRKAKRFNFLSAFFGGSGTSPQKDFKDSQEELQDRINTDKGHLNLDTENLNVNSFKKVDAQQKVNNLSAIPEAARTDAQKEELKTQQGLLLKYTDDEINIKKKASEDGLQLQDDSNAKIVAADEHAKNQKIQIAQQSFKAGEQLANAAFDAQAKRISRQMQDVENLASFEMKLAGNNSSAKIKIAQEEQAKMRELRRQQAQNEKTHSVFSAFINTAQGVTAALSLAPPASFILAAAVGLAGAVEISKITSEPLPAYKGGRWGGKKELARVNELGFELGEKGGKFRLLGSGKDSLVQLEEGETVHTHEQSVKILEAKSAAKNWMDTLLQGTGAHRQIEDSHRREQLRPLTKADYQDAMIQAIKTMPAPAEKVITPPERYFKQRDRNGLG